MDVFRSLVPNRWPNGLDFRVLCSVCRVALACSSLPKSQPVRDTDSIAPDMAGDEMDSVNVASQLLVLQQQLGDLQNLMEQRFAEVSLKLDAQMPTSLPEKAEEAVPAADGGKRSESAETAGRRDSAIPNWDTLRSSVVTDASAVSAKRDSMASATSVYGSRRSARTAGARRSIISVTRKSAASATSSTLSRKNGTMLSNATNRSALSIRLMGVVSHRSGSRMIWDATKSQRQAAKLQAKRLGERRSLRDSSRESLETGGTATTSSWVTDLAGKVVDSVFVTHGVMLLVFAHALLLGFEIDRAANSAQEPIPEWFSIANLIIVSIFVLELLLKFLQLGCSQFWCGMDSGWNAFDGCIVTLCVADVIVDFWSRSLTASTAFEELGTWRTLRFIRAMQTIRIVRIFRYVVALRTLAVSIVATMSSLLWTLALLAMMFYAFSLVLTQQVAEHCRFILVESAGQSQCSDDLQLYWGSVAESALTLFMAISQGMDWQVALRPLWDVSYLAVCAMLLYVSITILAILNVFCNTAMESASRDKDVAARNLAASRSQQAKQLKEVFQEMDRLDMNAISIEDLDEAMESSQLQHFLESMGISTDDVWTLFLLLDVEEKGVIEIDAFVSGCMGMYGTARSMQMAKLSYENTLMRQAVAEFKEDVAKEFAELKEHVGIYDVEVPLEIHKVDTL
eukprot:s734_g18.t2